MSDQKALLFEQSQNNCTVVSISMSIYVTSLHSSSVGGDNGTETGLLTDRKQHKKKNYYREMSNENNVCQRHNEVKYKIKDNFALFFSQGEQ